MLNKRGQGLQVSTVILIILALLILVILAIFVTGGFAKFAERLGFIQRTSVSLEEARLNCQTWCNNAPLNRQARDDFCKKSQNIDTNGDGEITPTTESYTCSPTSDVGPGFNHLGITCDDIDPPC